MAGQILKIYLPDTKNLNLVIMNLDLNLVDLVYCARACVAACRAAPRAASIDPAARAVLHSAVLTQAKYDTR